MSNNKSTNTKRIVKNTIVLYARMAVTMVITLYSSRIILLALGISDYGLYNVVGGVVLMLAFLRSSLTSATQRFLSFEMGRKDWNRLQKVFSMSLTTHIIIAFVIIVLAETIGLWFLNTHIQIPDGREVAANWVFQFAAVSLAISVITVPYHASTISHEKMTFFAWVSILDAVLKLGFAFTLLLTSSDRLILYGGLMMLTNVINFVLYWWYNRKNFIETKYQLFWDKNLFKKLFSFSGWTIWGQLAVVGSAQGKNILINIFYSVAANAAMGVAHQVNGALVSLTSNFQTAFQPQLTKSYAAKDYDYLKSLIIYASKVSFFLLFIVSLPFMLNIEWVLSVWLTEVPEYAGTFCILYIISSILNALATPLWISIFATGKIRTYQIAISVAYFTEIATIYLLFKVGFPPTTAMVVKVILNASMLLIRMIFAKRTVECFSMVVYAKRVLLPIIFSTSVTIVFILIFYQSVCDVIFMQILYTFLAFIVSVVSAYYIGLNSSERHTINNFVMKRIKNKIT